MTAQPGRWVTYIDAEGEDPRRSERMKEAYGVDVRVYCKFWGNPDTGFIDKYYCRFVADGKDYKIEETLENNLTKEVDFNGKKYSRYVDAELDLVALLKE